MPEKNDTVMEVLTYLASCSVLWPRPSLAAASEIRVWVTETPSAQVG